MTVIPIRWNQPAQNQETKIQGQDPVDRIVLFDPCGTFKEKLRSEGLETVSLYSFRLYSCIPSSWLEVNRAAHSTSHLSPCNVLQFLNLASSAHL